MENVNDVFFERRAFLKNYKSELLSCVYFNELRKMDEENSSGYDFVQYANYSILFSEFLFALKKFFAEERRMTTNEPFRLHGDHFYKNPFFRCTLTELENWVVVEFQDDDFFKLLRLYLYTLDEINYPFLKDRITDFSSYFHIYENKLKIKKYFGTRVVNRLYKSTRNANELYCLSGQRVDVLIDFSKKLQKFNQPFLEDYKEKRCVAISVMNKGLNEKRFFSLSGFWDYSEIKKYPFLQGHNKIDTDCREGDFEKLFNNSSLGKKYTWCKIKGNMKSFMYNVGRITELKELKENGILGDVKNHFSCCERKILSYVELSNKTNIQSLSLQIRFKPCSDCEQAIKDFETQWNKKIAIGSFK